MSYTPDVLTEAAFYRAANEKLGAALADMAEERDRLADELCNQRWTEIIYVAGCAFMLAAGLAAGYSIGVAQ